MPNRNPIFWMSFCLLVLLASACSPSVDPSQPAVVSPTPASSESLPPTSPPQTSTSPPALKPPDSDTPAAGICTETDQEVVEAKLNDPPPPDPRCVKVRPDQHLKITNTTPTSQQLSLGQYNLTLQPGETYTFPQSLGEFLAPGAHLMLNGPEVWLVVPESQSSVDKQLTSITLSGHTDAVNRIAWSPDGSLLASASNDHTLRLWDREGQLLKTLSEHTDWVTSLAWSPDGSLLASGSADQTVRLWNAAGELVKTIEVGAGTVYGLAWSPDGRWLSTGSVYSPDSNSVHTWTASGELVFETSTSFSGGKFYNLAWSPDGRYLLGGAIDYAVWNADGTQAAYIESCQNCVPSWGAAWSPDSQKFALGDESGLVQVFSPNGSLFWSGQAYCCVMSTAWSPDAELLAGANSLWSANGVLQSSLVGQPGMLAWSPDGQYLAGAARDNSLRIWDRTGSLLAVGPGHRAEVNQLAWSPAGQLLASASSDQTLRIWQLGP